MSLSSLRRSQAAAALCAVALLSACSSGPGADPAVNSPSPSYGQGTATKLSTDPQTWTTYNGGNSRAGLSTAAPVSATPAVAWQAQLDGAVYGQPLLMGNQVYAATEDDSVYALNEKTGAVLWRTHLASPQPLSALPCGDIDPLGITSTMVFDPATDSLFALAEENGGHHVLFALDPADGTVKWKRAAEPPAGVPIDTQQRGALTLAFGRVYIGFGGLDGDCANYIGSVVGVPANNAGASVTYHIPTAREGGIWAPGGLVVDGNELFAVDGNGASETAYDGSDSMVALSPTLTRLGFFAPSTWVQDNQNDKDFGIMTPVPVGGDLLSVGKNGYAYLLDPAKLGGIGGQLAQLSVCPAFGSGAVQGTTVYVSCHSGNTVALSVANGAIKVLWTSNTPTNGSPTVDGNAVWTTDFDSGVLYRLNATTGAQTGQVTLGALPHFASPTLGPGRVYVGTMSGVTAVAQ
ncbi:MAG TPA: PQQ-binding-like beta-propeller repeat protein [Actinocrinis sp.]|jgi:outer membrane protein assembly factor BamB